MTLRGAKRAFLSLPLLVVGAISLGAVLYWGSLRLRVPIEPLVALYAAAGLDALLLRRRVRASGFSVVEGRGR